ncbi:MAG: rhodanese-like domain-containing protein [Gammaproteobacteria bacterium]|jgi:rhodanese-related sulfurtransferase
MTFKTLFILLAFMMALEVRADEQTLAEYLKQFDYDARVEMKAGTRELIKLLQTGKVQLIDIRFKEEYAAWHMGAATNIPINELPERLDELDKSKIIVTACPHRDRAIIAMAYLKTKGYETMYLKDGLIGLAEYLRGDNAYDFIHQMRK